MVFFSFLLSVCSIPGVIIFCRHFHLYDYASKRKIHNGDIPRLGSVGFVVSFCIASILYAHLSVSETFTHIFPLIAAGCIIFMFGIVDDIINLPGKVKLLFQAIAALIIVLSGHQFTEICFIHLPTAAGMFISFCWIIGIINAFNLIDGIDGLCGGISVLVLGTLGIIFYRSARPTAAVCFILAAAVCGFLIYNFPPAKIFMGDGGSQFLGFMIASLPLYKSTWNFEYNKFLIIVVLVSIPLLDTIAAMIRRTYEHRSFFSPDREHLHHKLLNIGFSRVQVLFGILLNQIVLCLSAGLSMYLKGWKGAVMLTISLAFMILLFSLVHYANTAVNRIHMNSNIQPEYRPDRISHYITASEI